MLSAMIWDPKDSQLVNEAKLQSKEALRGGQTNRGVEGGNGKTATPSEAQPD